jgi:hypothetical protein
MGSKANLLNSEIQDILIAQNIQKKSTFVKFFLRKIFATVVGTTIQDIQLTVSMRQYKKQLLAKI